MGRVVVPRLPRYGEAVDDHQVPFARRAAEAGLVTLVEDPTTLPGVLASTPPPPATIHDNGAIVAELRAYLRDLVGYSR